MSGQLLSVLITGNTNCCYSDDPAAATAAAAAVSADDTDWATTTNVASLYAGRRSQRRDAADPGLSLATLISHVHVWYSMVRGVVKKWSKSFEPGYLRIHFWTTSVTGFSSRLLSVLFKHYMSSACLLYRRHHRRRFWHATLRLHSVIRRHHPPQRAVLSQICCFGKCKMVVLSTLSDTIY